MIAFARSSAKSSGDANSIGMAGRLRRLWSEDPMLLAITMAIVALVAAYFLFAPAEIATLFGAEAFSDFLRDAGQQVGGAGGLGAAGAAAAGAAAGGEAHGPSIAQTSAERDGLPRDYTTPGKPGEYYPDGSGAPTVERDGKLYVKDYWHGRFQGWREVYRVEGGRGFVDPGEDQPADLLGMRG